MTNINETWPIVNNSDKSGAYFTDGGEGGDVTKEDRKRRVLTFLVDSRMALPRKALYRNLRYQGASFSDSSLQNYLRELREEGLVERVDAQAFAEGKVVSSDEDPGYWLATGDGAKAVEDERLDRESDIDTSHL